MIERRATPRHRHYLNESPHSPPWWMLPALLMAFASIVTVALWAILT